MFFGIIVFEVIRLRFKGIYWILSIVLALICGCFIGLALLKGNTGSVADWVSGLGSLGAIIAVYYQVREQRIEYENDKIASIIIAADWRHSDDWTGGIVTTKPEFFCWAVNNGQSAGSFKFVGLCTDKHYKEIQSLDVENQQAQRQDLMKRYIHSDELTSDILKQDFERIEPKGVSKTVTLPINTVLEKFDDKERDGLHVVYMNPFGDLFDTKLVQAPDSTSDS